MNSPWARRLVTVLVALAVVAVAAATFVFSYAGMHAIALTGGVSAQLARYYPGLFDAVLVIACVAVVMLRDGRWWARAWAWVVLVVVLAAIGASDVLHAMNYTLRHRPTEGIVAAAPVAAVLLAFSLLLTLLRTARTRPAPQVVTEPVAALPAAVPSVALPPVPAEPAEPAVPAEPAAEAGAVMPPPAVVSSVSAPSVPEPSVPAPSVPAPAAAGEPAPPTVDIPAVEVPAAPPEPEPEPKSEREPEPEPEPAVEPAAESPRVSGGIRYASGGGVKKGDTAEPPVSGPAAESSPAGGRLVDPVDDRIDEQEHWEPAAAGPFAGLVYAAHDDDMAGEDSDGAPEPVGESAVRQPVPHLNRVRSTPARPTDDEDE
ncbi:MAG TPA: DUF2637 domain-containing protein [Trebonia sp.]|nr:DUF2637 domain-containing protein [Trebonia sp.]